MGEQEPQINLNLNGEKYELTRRNTRLYTFLGRTAFDHIFILNDEQPKENTVTGLYLPRETMGAEKFDIIADYMRDNLYPLHENLLEVPEGDENIITSMLSKDLEDTIPDDWT